AVTLSADKTSLRVGENATLTVTVKGLQAIEEEIPLHLENVSTQIIRMSGGNKRTITIDPREVGEDGTFVREIALSGLRAGSFGIVSSLFPVPGGGLLQEINHDEAESKKWDSDKPPHTHSLSSKWKGDGHDYEESKKWQKDGHGYEPSKTWKGDEHVYKDSGTWGADGHNYDLSKTWEGDEHIYITTRRWGKDNHRYNES
ncbi:MAG: hypothetical protein GY940_32875, partial [bacterium]|nr:hypothetical protein [bacterium]